MNTIKHAISKGRRVKNDNPDFKSYPFYFPLPSIQILCYHATTLASAPRSHKEK